METDGIRDIIYKSQNGYIPGGVEASLHDICINLCDALDTLEKRIKRIEDAPPYNAPSSTARLRGSWGLKGEMR